MTKRTMGLVAGGMLGVIGAALAMGNKNARNRIMHDTKDIVKKTAHMIDM